MNEEIFLETLTDLMDTEAELKMDTVLADVEEWDSLSLVSFLSLCAKHAKERVEPKEVRNAKTVQDLFQLINR